MTVSPEHRPDRSRGQGKRNMSLSSVNCSPISRLHTLTGRPVLPSPFTQSREHCVFSVARVLTLVAGGACASIIYGTLKFTHTPSNRMIILWGQVRGQMREQMRELGQLPEETILNAIWVGLLGVQVLMVFGVIVIGLVRRIQTNRMLRARRRSLKSQLL